MVHDKRVKDRIHEFLGIDISDGSILDELKKYFERKNFMEITVGKTGDFETINEAIDFVLDLPVYPLRVDIKLVGMFEMKEQVIIKNKDLGFINITSDYTVDVIPTNINECIRVNLSPEFNVVPIFYGKNSILPTIDVLFRFNRTAPSSEICSKSGSGVLVDNSKVKIKPNKGFINFPFIGACGINGSNIVANHCKFDNNGNRDKLNTNNISEAYGDGVRVWSSTFSGSYATANRCGDMGFNISQGSKAHLNRAKGNDCGHHGLIVTSGSICTARNSEFIDTIDDNVVAYAGSNIDLRNSNVSGSVVNFGLVATRSCNVNFENGIANNCGRSGVISNRGSVIDMTNGTTKNNKEHGVMCSNNSRVDFSGGTSNDNAIDGLHSTHGSIIQARNSKIHNNGRDGIMGYAGNVYAQNSDINNSGRRGIEATRGGEVLANRSKVRNSKDFGIHAYTSKIDIAFGEVTGSGNNAIVSTRGGEVYADSVKISGNSGTDFNVYYASRIYCSNSSGSANKSVNHLGSGGMIISNSVGNA